MLIGILPLSITAKPMARYQLSIPWPDHFSLQQPRFTLAEVSLLADVTYETAKLWLHRGRFTPASKRHGARWLMSAADAIRLSVTRTLLDYGIPKAEPVGLMETIEQRATELQHGASTTEDCEAFIWPHDGIWFFESGSDVSGLAPVHVPEACVRLKVDRLIERTVCDALLLLEAEPRQPRTLGDLLRQQHDDDEDKDL